jgi:uncharacterized protein YqgC (DUF456 family)
MFHYLSKHPRSAGIVTGALIGSIVGLWIGNIGVARAGGAIGVTGWSIGTIVGAYIGFRIGEWFSRRKANTEI